MAPSRRWRSGCSVGIVVLGYGENAHRLAASAQAFLSETLEGNRFEIKETLMPDSMHPSAVGMRIIATRLEPLVSQLVASSKLPQTSR